MVSGFTPTAAASSATRSPDVETVVALTPSTLNLGVRSNVKPGVLARLPGGGKQSGQGEQHPGGEVAKGDGGGAVVTGCRRRCWRRPEVFRVKPA
jgi:hypothetical protein